MKNDITLSVTLLKRRKKTDGRTPVYIRIRQNGKYSLLSANIAVRATYWTGKYGKWVKGGTKTGHPRADRINHDIQKILWELEDLIDSAGDNLTRKQLVNLYRGKDSGQFQAHATRYAKRLADEGKYSSQSQIKAAASKFEDFTKPELKFSEITPQLLNDFQDWMKDELGNHPNTIRKTMNRIKAVTRDAYKKDLATNLPFQDPKFEKVSSVESKKDALSINQIFDIENLSLAEGSDLWHTRNYFLFSFWCGGIRFTDLALLRWENVKDGRLKYQMGKNDKYKDIALRSEALEILAPYKEALNQKYEGMQEDLKPETIADMKDREIIFPLVQEYRDADQFTLKKKAHSQNVLVNRSLKDLARKASIEIKLTFHISRHSFARWAVGSDEYDIRGIQKMLAHSKIRTTERYLGSLSDYSLDQTHKASEQATKKRRQEYNTNHQ